MFRAADYQLIMRQLYKLSLDKVLPRCVLNHERDDVLWECHLGVVGGHVGVKATTRKLLQAELWWRMIFRDPKKYSNNYDVCQRVGRPSHQNELLLQPVHTLQIFEKWAVNFIGLINPLKHHYHDRYSIIAT